MKSKLLKLAYEHFTAYTNWLKTQNLSQHDVRAQLCRVNHFLVFLGTEFSGTENVFSDSFRRDDALREYKTYSRRDLKSPVNMVNTTIDAIDKFFQYLGLPPTRLTHDLPEPIKPLSDEQLYRMEHHIQEKLTPREKALITMLLLAGLSPQECAAIELDDVRLSTTGGFVMLGQGDERFQFNLDARCRIVVRAYLEDRANRYPHTDQAAFFIDDRGFRLTASAVDLVARQLGRELGLDITAKTLQHTFQYHEAKRQNKVLLAAELLSGVVQVS